MVTPPSTVHNLQLWTKRARQVRALAKRVIEGKESIIEGSIKMLTFRTWLHARTDDDFKIFRVVYTESHHLPIGKARAHWNPKALLEKDLEIKRVEDFYRARVIESAARILQKYS